MKAKVVKRAPTVCIRKEPRPADIDRLRTAAHRTVMKLAAAPAAISADEVQRAYLTEIWAAVVACAVKERG